MSDQWQPIETHPKIRIYTDSVEALFKDPDGNVRTGTIISNVHNFIIRSDLDLGDFSACAYWPKELFPTHWMPLPPPPKEIVATADSGGKV